MRVESIAGLWSQNLESYELLIEWKTNTAIRVQSRVDLHLLDSKDCGKPWRAAAAKALGPCLGSDFRTLPHQAGQVLFYVLGPDPDERVQAFMILVVEAVLRDNFAKLKINQKNQALIATM